MKSLYILLVAIAVSAASCMTKEGEPGPAGESGLAKEGKISGTLAYKDHEGNAVNIPFEYSYYESKSDNKFSYDEVSEDYTLDFFRRDLKDYNNFLSFSNLVGTKMNNQFTAPTGGTFEFSLLKVIGDDLFEFNGYFDASDPNSSYTVTNFVFNPETGRLMYNFELTFAPSSINYEGKYDDAENAVVKGRVDVTLNRTPIFSSPQTNM